MTALNVHRCRFVDYSPSAVTALAIPPFPPPDVHSTSSLPPIYTRPTPLAVGHANGNIDIYEWSSSPSQPQSPQAWVLLKTMAGHSSTKVDSVIFTLRNTHLSKVTNVFESKNLRLFSTGGGSELLEWDIDASCVLRTIGSQGGSIWSLAANPSCTLLALGCDDGSIRIISLAEDSLHHARRLDRSNSRPLSLAWGPSSLTGATSASQPALEHETVTDDEDEDIWQDSWLVAGGSDSSLRKWDLKTGRVVERMMTDKVRAQRTLVWAVATLSDGTIISGDSMGTVKVWDALTCTQIASFPAHSADVLCLSVGPDGSTIYASGVDQKISQFSLVSGAASRWIHTCSRRMHSHDIRALITWPPHQSFASSTLSSSEPYPVALSRSIASFVISGGLDMSVCFCPSTPPTLADKALNLVTGNSSVFEDAYYRRMPFGLPPCTVVQMSRSAKLVLCRNDAALSIWKLAQAFPSSGLHTNISDKPGWHKIAEMQLKTTTNLVASAISENGEWIVASDYYEIKLFRLKLVDGDHTLHRVKSISDALLPYLSSATHSLGASALTFTPDSRRLVMGMWASAAIIVIDLNDSVQDSPRVLRVFRNHSNVYLPLVPPDPDVDDAQMIKTGLSKLPITEASQPVIRCMAVSPDGQWLATSDSLHRTHIFNLDSVKHHCTLPSFPYSIEALAFDPADPATLYLGFANNTIQIFQVESKLFPEWSHNVCNNLPRRFTQLHDSLRGLLFDPVVSPSELSLVSGGSRQIYAWGSSWLCKLKLDIPVTTQNSTKKRPRDDMKPAGDNAARDHKDRTEADEREQFDVLTKYRNMLCVDFLGPKELVVVERPIMDVLQSLPPAFFKPKYGT